MATATEHRTVTERFTDLFHEIEQSDGYDIEAAKVEIAEQIYLAMKQQNVANADLARRLGKSRAYATKVLQGNTNFTLESLVKIARVLDCQLDLKFSVRRSASELDASAATAATRKSITLTRPIRKKQSTRTKSKPAARS